MKIECKVSCRLPSEYSHPQSKGKIRLLLYSFDDEKQVEESKKKLGIGFNSKGKILNQNQNGSFEGMGKEATLASNKKAGGIALENTNRNLADSTNDLQPPIVPIHSRLNDSAANPNQVSTLANSNAKTNSNHPPSSSQLKNFEHHALFPSNNFHLVMIFGDTFYSKSLEQVRNGDTRQSLEMRGASLWKQNEKYKKLWQDDEHFVWNDSVHTQDDHPLYHSTDSDKDENIYSTNVKNSESINPLVRMHSSCFTGETLGSLRCDCAEQLHSAISQMSAENSGLLIYLHQEGRGIGLLSKLFAYNLIDTMKYDTYTANVALGHLPDERDYKVASLILNDLGVNQCRLLTNNPDKIEQLRKDGINITSRVEMIPMSWSSSTSSAHEQDKESDLYSDNTSTESNAPSTTLGEKQSMNSTLIRQTQLAQDRDGYLLTKIKKMGHKLSVPAFLETLLADTGVAAEKVMRVHE